MDFRNAGESWRSLGHGLTSSLISTCMFFGLFTRKVTSGTCICTTKDTATNYSEKSLVVRHVIPCIQKFLHFFSLFMVFVGALCLNSRFSGDHFLVYV